MLCLAGAGAGVGRRRSPSGAARGIGRPLGGHDSFGWASPWRLAWQSTCMAAHWPKPACCIIFWSFIRSRWRRERSSRCRPGRRPRLRRERPRTLVLNDGTSIRPNSPSTSTTLPRSSCRLGIELELPKIFGHQITKFMVLELLAAVLMVLIFVPLARKLSDGRPPKGRFWNMFEAIVLFLRNEVVRPAIGRHDADRFLPLDPHAVLLHFVLQSDGPDSWFGSPTASINATAPLGGRSPSWPASDRA